MQSLLLSGKTGPRCSLGSQWVPHTVMTQLSINREITQTHFTPCVKLAQRIWIKAKIIKPVKENIGSNSRGLEIVFLAVSKSEGGG